MVEEELQRPEMKVGAVPLTERDKYDFLPYIDRDAEILPSAKGTWKTDAKAVAFMSALQKGEDLTQTDWSGINLKGADLSGANLYGVSLKKANLMDANLSGANLEWADLSYAYCENTDFSGANMKDTQMKGVFYKNCQLEGANIDEELKKYLHSIEWFVSQIETGKIKLEEIPQDQLNYLDLRTIDMRLVKIEEGIDLSALVLDGVNLSGVYIPRGHFLNLALMWKIRQKAKLVMQRTQKALSLMYLRLKEERKEKLKAYAKEQFLKPRIVPSYAITLKRPPAKMTTDIISTETKKTEGKTHTKQPTQEAPFLKTLIKGAKLPTLKPKVKKRA